MKVPDARKKLKSCQQEHLFDLWPQFSIPERLRFIRQIEELSIQEVDHLLSLVDQVKTECEIHPPQSYVTLNEIPKSCYERGLNLTSLGKVGCLVVAGGQGSRLRSDKPKGMLPVTAIKKKSLFQLIAEKTALLSQRFNRLLPLAIMTSPINHRAVESYFQENDYFGLDPKQVSFFQQGTLPLIEFDGKLFLEQPGRIAIGPDGNGSVFHHFVQSGIYAKWQKLGVEWVNCVQIDNPLADPFDFSLIGFHESESAEVTVKCSLRESEVEKVGLLATKDGRTCVAEYSEVSLEEKQARLADGSLKYPLANLSLFAFSMPFLEKAAAFFPSMPLHIAKKAAFYLDEAGASHLSLEPIAYKFERFIFDVLPLSSQVRLLVYPRENCFAPLKSEIGEGSLLALQEKLQAYDKATFEQVTGIRIPDDALFELSPEFYYPSKELLSSWHGRSIPTSSYIESSI
ncbi:MAG: hypothetical protein K0S07_1065 [Chlamydiales bacterium]|nr:hypothetical protein [Chlamydiales bacterium]